MQAFCTLRLDCGAMVATAQYIPDSLVDVQLVPLESKSTHLYVNKKYSSLEKNMLSYVV